MSNKRMFSLRIVNSARFLKMPVDSQVLYFHLGMRADDDGVVEAYPIMEMLGSNEDNLKVLVAKSLVKILNEDLVAFITDWREHNLLRADRKVDSIYKNLLLKVVPEADLLEPKPRADTGVIPRQLTTGRPLDGLVKVRLGKDRLILNEIRKPNLGEDLSSNGQNEKDAAGLVAPDDLFPETSELSLAEWLYGLWNKYPTAESVGAQRSKNTYAKSQLLKPCKKLTADMVSAVNLWKKRPRSELENALKAYITEILNRNPKSDYAKHRFSFYEFFSQPNGIKKFLNL